MDEKVLKAINGLSKRVTAIERKLERYLLDKHELNAEAIGGTEEAVLEVAGMAAGNSEAIQGAEEAILEIAGLVAELAGANENSEEG